MFKPILMMSFLLAFGVLPILCKTLPITTREGTALKIAAFNVQVFGVRKMENQMVEDVLIKIILRYDIILIQEIRSADDDPINELLESVNRFSSPPGIYKMALSVRLGRTVSKEQYAYLYRSDKVTLEDSYVFDDGDESTKTDKFQREPFIVRFKAHNTYVSDFAMVAIHTSPSEAVPEIDRLVDVYDDITRKWSLNDVMILGDFNAGCSYVIKSAWEKIRLATDRRFYWLFSDDVDTTVAKSDCPYDRMVVAGHNMIRGVFADSASVFRYDEAYGLNQEQAEDVSDHWPIEIQLKDSTYRDEERFFAESVTVTNKDGLMEPVSKSVLYSLRSTSKNPLLSQGFSVKTTYTKTGKIDEIILTKAVDSDEMARNAVKTFHKYFPSLVSASQVAVSDRKIFKISTFEDVHCSREVSKETVYQMLSNKCSGMRLPTINAVQLICSTSLGLCEIGIQAALNSL
ncbi:hypothetical protein ACROYT_G024103 [Oculina patagonica]